MAYELCMRANSPRARRPARRVILAWPLSKRAWLYALVSLLSLSAYLRFRSVVRPFRNEYQEDP